MAANGAAAEISAAVTDAALSTINLPSADTPTRCVVCNRTAKNRCSSCKNAHYCSKDCQKKDWGMHRLVCKTFKDFQERPGPNCRRGIFFPADDSRPRFVWIEHYGDKFYEMDPTTHIGKSSPRTLHFDRRYPLHRSLGYNMSIWYNDNFLCDGSPVNKCLEEWLGPVVAPRWRGSFLAQGYDGEKLGIDGDALDLDTTALAPVIHYFKNRGLH